MTQKSSLANPIQGYDCLLKLILIGQASSGKSSLVNRFVDNNYSEDSLTTIGTDLRSITLKIDEAAVRL